MFQHSLGVGACKLSYNIHIYIFFWGGGEGGGEREGLWGYSKQGYGPGVEGGVQKGEDTMVIYNILIFVFL